MNLELSIKDVSVMIGMPTHRDIPPATVKCLLETQQTMHMRGMDYHIEIQHGSSLVHHARTKTAHSFLKSNFKRLFWIDSDIVWRAEDFLKLVALSTKMECVCASYPLRHDPIEFNLNVESVTTPMLMNQYGCLPVKGAGLGFTIVQRKVMEELAAKAPKLKFPTTGDELVANIFRCDDSDGLARGEDMAFFADVLDLGYTVNLDPTIELGHIGSKEYTGSIIDHLVKTKLEAA